MSRLLDKLAEEVRAAPSRKALAAFASEVLGRLAARRASSMGREQVDTLASTHSVSFDDASLPSGNLLSILEQGPDGAVEHGLVSAVAVSELADLLGEEASRDERNAVFDRWVERADWLERETEYRVYPYVDRFLDETSSSAFWDRFADSVIQERGSSAAAVSRLAARVTAVADIDSDAARSALRRIGNHAPSPVARAIAGGPHSGAVTEIQGVFSRAPAGGAIGVLRLVSGLALVQGLLSVIGWAFRSRRSASLRLTNEGLELNESHDLLGRTVREARSFFPFEEVTTLCREVRYPRLMLLVGSAALALGLLVGGLWVGEGVRSGETYLLLVGGGVLLGGALLDLGLNVLPRARHGLVACSIDFERARGIRIHGIPLEAADAFLLATGGRIGRANSDS